eukprot:2717001-Ditylum_brightwellii.AAC.1
MESLQAESLGVLSVLRFLLQYKKHFNVSITGDSTVHYCNNSTLCNRMQTMQQDQTTTPMQTIQSDWDVHMAIDETVQELQITLKTYHVYGHQDTRNKPNLMEDKAKGLNKHKGHKHTKPSKKKKPHGKPD